MVTFTRQALYDLVWAKPVRTVAAELGISGVGLKKACAKANVPVPERGHWARLAAGKTVLKVRLPLRGPGMDDEVSFGESVRHWPPNPEAELAEPEPVRPVFTEDIDALELRVRKLVGKVAFVRTLESPERSLGKILQKDEQRRQKMIQTGYSWDAPLFDAPFEQRRFKLINSIFIALTRAGMKPDISGSAARHLGVLVGATRVALTLDHPQAKANRWGEHQIHGGPVGALRLEILRNRDGSKVQTFEDSDGKKLEVQLTEIVVAVIVAGEQHHRTWATEHHEYRLKRREEMRHEIVRRRQEAERKESERLEQLERERRERLMGHAASWRSATDLRAFVSLVEARAREADVDATAWVSWATAIADRLDPLTDFTLVFKEPEIAS